MMRDLTIMLVRQNVTKCCYLQEKHEGEEVDFDQSYFFPEWKEHSEDVQASIADSDSAFETELRLAASAA